MRTCFLISALALAGCSEQPFFVSDIGIDEDVEDPACALVAEVEVLRFDAELREDGVEFMNPCLLAAEVVLDDPDGAFTFEVAPSEDGATVWVDIQLVATEPGVYEAQLVYDGEQGAAGVELFAEIEASE